MQRIEVVLAQRAQQVARKHYPLRTPLSQTVFSEEVDALDFIRSLISAGMSSRE